MFSTEYYIPEHWLLVEIGDMHKILATWDGSYLGGASWRLNSGIDKVEIDGDYFLFHGYSGSIYKCHKDNYGTNWMGASVISSYGLKELDGYEEFIKEATSC